MNPVRLFIFGVALMSLIDLSFMWGGGFPRELGATTSGEVSGRVLASIGDRC